MIGFVTTQEQADAGATMSVPQQAAVSTFMADEIAAVRWDKIKRLYFPVWQLASANAICMKILVENLLMMDLLILQEYGQLN